jgi:hypothetical protein
LKVLVIGVAGTGKSYLVKAMKRRGQNAVDADKGLATFTDKYGNEVRYNPKGGGRWWRSHYYVLKMEKLEKLFESSESIYLFGDVGGQPGKGNGLLDVAPLFDRVCYLRATPRLIRDRLARRRGNPFGKNPEEVERTMKHKAKMDWIARKSKFEVVDASLTAEKIIRLIMNPEIRNRS